MDRQRHLQDDHTSGNWSLGSNYHRCSQSRKISIGVVVDSSAKMKGKNGKGVMAELQMSDNVTSAKDDPAESKQKGKELLPPDLGRQNKAPCKKSSPLVGTKTSHQNVSYSDTIGHPEKVSSLPSTSNVLLQPSGSKVGGEMKPGSCFATPMVNLHARDANEKNSKKNSYQKEGGNHGIMGRGEQSSYVTVQKVLVTEKGITEQGTSERGNSGNVTLRMKVQELLGNVHSPNKNQSFGTGATNRKPKSKTNISASLAAIRRQHLHTRDTNSESLDHKIKRPVTRSLNHKKPQAQKSAPKKQDTLSWDNQARLDENEFCFVETWSRRPSTDVNHGSTMLKRKEREIFATRPVKKCFVEGVHKDESQQATDGRKTKAAAVNVSLFGQRTGDSEIVKPNTETKKKTRHQFEAGGNSGSMLYNTVDQDPFAKHTITNNVGDLKSPTFEFKTAAVTSSPRSLFQTNQEDLDVNSQSDRAFKTKGTRSFDSIGSSKRGRCNANTKNFVTNSRDSPIVEPATLIIGGRKENRCSRSPIKEVQYESSEDGSPDTVPIISEDCHGNRWSVSPRQEEDSESSEDSVPIKGDGDSDKFWDSSEHDALVGAVKLFALALERVQRKIHATTSRQSAEILLSVSNNIQSQLQNVESMIKNQVGKLTNLGKSKRMLPENQCQEQQEQLKRIYEKFKEEVDQHLEKCRNTVEGLEAHHIEVRGMVEKQRLSHRKLLLQTEQAIETQLNDAQRRLSDVHRLAREKMLQLKYGIGECLKQGLLG